MSTLVGNPEDRFSRDVAHIVSLRIHFSLLISDRHAFTVLRSKNVIYQRYQLLVLEVRVPDDGVSRSENWCRDYQYLCEDFHRRPVGCRIANHWV